MNISSLTMQYKGNARSNKRNNLYSTNSVSFKRLPQIKADNLIMKSAKKGTSFGDKITDKIAVGIGKLLDTKLFQKMVNKLKNTNIVSHILTLSSFMVTGSYIRNIHKSKKIEKERKKPLMINAALSGAMAFVGSYTIDKALDKPLDKFGDSFKKAHKNDPKLGKYLDGIKICKSALIFGMIYRFVVPVIAAGLAEKIVNIQDKNKKQKA